MAGRARRWWVAGVLVGALACAGDEEGRNGDGDANGDSGGLGPHEFSIVVDFSLDFAGRLNREQRNIIELAAERWAERIDADFPSLPAGTTWTIRDPGESGAFTQVTVDEPIDDMVVFAVFGNVGGAAAIGGFASPADASLFGTMADRLEGDNFQPAVGFVVFGGGPWSLALDGSADTGSNVNMLGTALHELGHTLGLGSCDAWDEQVDPGSRSFTGPNVTALLGRSMLLSSDFSHINPSVRNLDGSQCVMIPQATSMDAVFPTEIDVTLLEDIGIETDLDL